MWNIEFKGKIQGDINQISTQKPLPEGAVQFREPDSAGKAFVDYRNGNRGVGF